MLRRLCVHAADNLGDVGELELLVARVDALGREREIEILARAKPALLEDGSEQLFGGPGIGGAFKDHERAALQILCDACARLFDVGSVGRLMLGDGGGYGDEDNAALADLLPIGCGGDIAVPTGRLAPPR